MITELLFGLLLLAIFVILIYWGLTLIDDILAMRFVWGHTWKNSFVLGWSYFVDNFSDLLKFKA